MIISQNNKDANIIRTLVLMEKDKTIADFRKHIEYDSRISAYNNRCIIISDYPVENQPDIKAHIYNTIISDKEEFEFRKVLLSQTPGSQNFIKVRLNNLNESKVNEATNHFGIEKPKEWDDSHYVYEFDLKDDGIYFIRKLRTPSNKYIVTNVLWRSTNIEDLKYLNGLSIDKTVKLD